MMPATSTQLSLEQKQQQQQPKRPSSAAPTRAAIAKPTAQSRIKPKDPAPEYHPAAASPSSSALVSASRHLQQQHVVSAEEFDKLFPWRSKNKTKKGRRVPNDSDDNINNDDHLTDDDRIHDGVGDDGRGAEDDSETFYSYPPPAPGRSIQRPSSATAAGRPMTPSQPQAQRHRHHQFSDPFDRTKYRTVLPRESKPPRVKEQKCAVQCHNPYYDDRRKYGLNTPPRTGSTSATAKRNRSRSPFNTSASQQHQSQRSRQQFGGPAHRYVAAANVAGNLRATNSNSRIPACGHRGCHDHDVAVRLRDDVAQAHREINIRDDTIAQLRHSLKRLAKSVNEAGEAAKSNLGDGGRGGDYHDDTNEHRHDDHPQDKLSSKQENKRLHLRIAQLQQRLVENRDASNAQWNRELYRIEEEERSAVFVDEIKRLNRHIEKLKASFAASAHGKQVADLQKAVRERSVAYNEAVARDRIQLQRVMEAEVDASRCRAAHDAAQLEVHDLRNKLETLADAPIQILDLQQQLNDRGNRLKIAQDQLASLQAGLHKAAAEAEQRSAEMNRAVAAANLERDRSAAAAEQAQKQLAAMHQASVRVSEDADAKVSTARREAAAKLETEAALLHDRERALRHDLAAAQAEIRRLQNENAMLAQKHDTEMREVTESEKRRQEAMTEQLNRYEFEREQERKMQAERELRRLDDERRQLMAQQAKLAEERERKAQERERQLQVEEEAEKLRESERQRKIQEQQQQEIEATREREHEEESKRRQIERETENILERQTQRERQQQQQEERRAAVVGSTSFNVHDHLVDETVNNDRSEPIVGSDRHVHRGRAEHVRQEPAPEVERETDTPLQVPLSAANDDNIALVADDPDIETSHSHQPDQGDDDGGDENNHEVDESKSNTQSSDDEGAQLDDSRFPHSAPADEQQQPHAPSAIRSPGTNNNNNNDTNTSNPLMNELDNHSPQQLPDVAAAHAQDPTSDNDLDHVRMSSRGDNWNPNTAVANAAESGQQQQQQQDQQTVSDLGGSIVELRQQRDTSIPASTAALPLPVPTSRLLQQQHDPQLSIKSDDDRDDRHRRLPALRSSDRADDSNNVVRENSGDTDEAVQRRRQPSSSPSPSCSSASRTSSDSNEKEVRRR